MQWADKETVKTSVNIEGNQKGKRSRSLLVPVTPFFKQSITVQRVAAFVAERVSFIVIDP